MKKNFNDPRGGLIIALGVLLTALWLVIAFGAYEESKREKYEVSVKPGAVTYGTLSTATVPAVSVSARRSSMPMISGGSVRSYAHYGHASMSKASGASSYRLHTTSSATVHSIGGGGSTGGGGAYGGGGASSSSKGINYSSGSVSMPTLAMATSSRSSSDVSGLTSGIASAASSFSQSAMTTTETSTPSSPARMGGIRRGKPSGTGEDGEWSDGGEGDGDWYRWDDWEGEWVAPTDGETRIEGGKTYKYVGTHPYGSWVLVGDQGDPTNPTPLDDAPWHWMLLLAVGYGVFHAIKIRKLRQIQ